MTQLSVIIPSRNEFKNLLWTLQGLQLELGDLDYEIITVLNQCDPDEAERLKKYWPATDGRLRVLPYDERPSCWGARNAGAAVARGDYLLFLDSHVIFRQGDLRRGFTYHHDWQGILHWGVNYWLDHPERTLFQYRWNGKRFWGSWSRERPSGPGYHILMSGACAALIDQGAWREMGGFNEHLGIYGGGEPYLDLKCHMFGFDVRCHPDYQLYHLAEKRGYAWNNDDLWRNFMIAAYALGGSDYLEPVYEHYRDRCNGHGPYLEKLDELKNEAVVLAATDREWIAASARRTLNEVLEPWKET